MLDPRMVSVYTLFHDWWGVIAVVVGGYKGWKWLTEFKTTTDQVNVTVAEQATRLEAAVKLLSDKLDAGQHALQIEVKEQTKVLSEEFKEMRNDFRTMFLLSNQPRQRVAAKRAPK